MIAPNPSGFGIPSPNATGFSFSIPQPNFGETKPTHTALPRPLINSTNSPPSLAGRAKRKIEEVIPESPRENENSETHPFEALTMARKGELINESFRTHKFESQTLFFNGHAYPLIIVGEGVFHTAYSFRDRTFHINENSSLDTSNKVIKFCHNKVKRKGIKDRTAADDLRAYQENEKKGIPQPKCYVNPTTHPFWIVERMPTKISGDGWANGQSYEDLSATDQTIIDFAKKYLTLNAQKICKGEGEFIGDFNRKNVMLSAEGMPVVIDPTLPETDDWNCKDNMRKNVKDWARKNPKIIQYLISDHDFPEMIKIKLIKKLLAK